jgi:hypothetical protein
MLRVRLRQNRQSPTACTVATKELHHGMQLPAMIERHNLPNVRPTASYSSHFFYLCFFVFVFVLFLFLEVYSFFNTSGAAPAPLKCWDAFTEPPAICIGVTPLSVLRRSGFAPCCSSNFTTSR